MLCRNAIHFLSKKKDFKHPEFFFNKVANRLLGLVHAYGCHISEVLFPSPLRMVMISTAAPTMFLNMYLSNASIGFLSLNFPIKSMLCHAFSSTYHVQYTFKILIRSCSLFNTPHAMAIQLFFDKYLF